MLKNKSKNIKGITLIALVITIIVLLILAGITINMITSQDGILSKTILAKGKMNEAEIEEKIKLAVTKAQINENGLDKNELKDELNKYFGDKYTLTENSDGSCVIEVEGVIYKVDSSGNILNSKYELATSEDGVLSESSGDSLSNYKIYGNSIQNGEPSPDNPIEIESVGDRTVNLFDMDTILPEQGWTKQEDGSYYIENNKSVYQKKLWKNTEGYTGQIKIDYKAKFLKDHSQSIAAGTTICVVYTDGTMKGVEFNDNKWTKDWRSADCNNISDASKTVDYVMWKYGTGDNSTWIKDIMITKDTSSTEYEPYGYKIPVQIRGKNLININKIGVKSGYYYDSIGNPSNENERFIKVGSVKCESLTQYSLSSNLKIYTVWFYSGNEAISRKEVFEKNNITFTTPENCNALRISLYNTSGIADTSAFEWIQLEKGEKNTLYEEYKEPITTNIYLNEPLRKIGDNADYIDFKSGKVVRKIKSITLNGNEDWKYEKLDYGNNFYTKIEDVIGNQNMPIFSNKFKYYTNGALTKDFSCRISSSKNLNLRYQNFDNIDNFKEWINSNNTEIMYQLATPIEEKIELPNILTGKGTNKVSIETKIQPSKMEINYYKTK